MTTIIAAPVPLPARLANVRYADKDYWNKRYLTQPCEFDWFYGYTALRRIVRAFAKRNRAVLHVGCGNSNFQEGMAKDGFQVINTDISEVVIEQMRSKHKDVRGLTYVLSDCRSMPEFLDCQFGTVIDKGTVDALLCSKDAGDNVTRMFSEISRVLVPGGTFLLITLGGPAQRLQLVNRPDFGWSVQVLLVQRVADHEFAATPEGRAIPLNDTPKPLPYIGPLPVAPDGSIEGLPHPFEATEYFYAYACRKAPLVLRGDNSGGGGEGARARLPEGWRATVRAVAQAVGGEGLLERGRRIKLVNRASFERQQRERALAVAGSTAQPPVAKAPPLSGGYAAAAGQGGCEVAGAARALGGQEGRGSLQQVVEGAETATEADGGQVDADAGEDEAACASAELQESLACQFTTCCHTADAGCHRPHADNCSQGTLSPSAGNVTPPGYEPCSPSVQGGEPGAEAQQPAAGSGDADAPPDPAEGDGQPLMAAAAEPAHSGRASKPISYRRLSACVVDAFSHLDAIDGEGGMHSAGWEETGAGAGGEHEARGLVRTL